MKTAAQVREMQAKIALELPDIPVYVQKEFEMAIDWAVNCRDTTAYIDFTCMNPRDVANTVKWLESNGYNADAEDVGDGRGCYHTRFTVNWDEPWTATTKRAAKRTTKR